MIISPGEILEEELKARRLTPKRLAQRIGKPLRVVSDILQARRPITADIALALADALNISAEFWMNLESNYRLHLARRRRAAG